MVLYQRINCTFENAMANYDWWAMIEWAKVYEDLIKYIIIATIL